MKSVTKSTALPALVLGEIGLIQNLGKENVPIYVGSEIQDNPSVYSKFAKQRVSFSDYTSPEFIDELCEFGRNLDQKAVLYSDDDHAILNIAQHQDRLKQYFLFSFPSEERVKKLMDKQLFCELIEKYDLPAPQSITLSSLGDLHQKPVSEMQFPCIIKPSFKQSWWDSDFDQKVGEYQKAIKCDTYDDLVNKYSLISDVNPHVVVQEFIPGGEDEIYSVNMFVDDQGTLKGYFIAQKLRTFPIRAGEGCYIVTVKDKQMLGMAKDVVERLSLTGLLNVQFKRDNRTGEPVLLEIHTRNSVWSYLGTAAGMNLAALYYQEMTGRQPEPQLDYKENVTFIFLEKDIKAFLQNLRDRQISVATWITSYFKKFVLGGYKWRDPMPIIMNWWFIIRRRLARIPSLKLF